MKEEAEGAGGKPKSKYIRAAKIGGAAVVGGTLIGITGGLAAPAVIAFASATTAANEFASRPRSRRGQSG